MQGEGDFALKGCQGPAVGLVNKLRRKETGLNAIVVGPKPPVEESTIGVKETCSTLLILFLYIILYMSLFLLVPAITSS